MEKLDKKELLKRFEKVIDKANELLDKEDVQKAKKLFNEAGENKAKQMVAITEVTALQDKYVQFGDKISQTALMIAITGNNLF